jgi:hypothetical protein
VQAQACLHKELELLVQAAQQHLVGTQPQEVVLDTLAPLVAARMQLVAPQ